MQFELPKRSFFVSSHQPTIARNVGGQDGGQATLDAILVTELHVALHGSRALSIAEAWSSGAGAFVSRAQAGQPHEHLVFFLCELLDGMVGGLVHDAFDDCPLGCDVRGSEAFQNRCWVPAASHAMRPFLASRLALKSPLF